MGHSTEGESVKKDGNGLKENPRIELIPTKLEEINNSFKDKEFIYILDMMWAADKSLESFKTKQGTLVTDVELNLDGKFSFNIKGTEIKRATYYGWALVENTEDNVVALNDYREHQEKLKDFEKIVKSKQKKLITLEKYQQI